MNKKVIFILGGVGVIGLGAFAFFKIRKSSRDKKAKEFMSELEDYRDPVGAGLSGSKAFDVNYTSQVLSKYKNVFVLSDADANKYAKQIKDAWGVFNDNENAIYGALQAVRDKLQISQIAKAYYALTGNNLIDDFKDKLSDSEIAYVMDIVNAKSDYTHS